MNDDELFLKELQVGFIEEAADLIEQCEQYSLELESTDNLKECIEVLFRNFHTIKGTAAAVEMQELSGYTHKVENLLVEIKKGKLEVNAKIINLLLEATDATKNYLIDQREGNESSMDVTDIENKVNFFLEGKQTQVEDIPQPEEEEENTSPLIEETKDVKKIPVNNKSTKPADEHIKLPLSKIDGLIDYLGEQIILQTALNYCKDNNNFTDEVMNKTIMQLNKITQDLQQTAISLRMFNLKPVFRKAQRIVRDTSLQMGKEINFSQIGENTELDKTIVDELSGPITHLIRNSVDHGIESKEERIALDKAPVGTIELQAFQRSGSFYLIITDDGKGLNAEKIRAKAIKVGLLKENEPIEDEKLYDYIFNSGFSTKEKATDISGRGVGMDVVKTAIQKLRGTIQVKSKPNKGCSFVIKLPLTLAIFNGMIVNVEGKKIIVPNSDVLQIIDKNNNSTCSIDKKNNLLRDGDFVYPVVNLHNIIGIRGDGQELTHKKDHSLYLITSYNQQKYAIKINDILGQQKVVLKNLPASLSELQGISGVTILGDGSVSLILDVNKSLSIYNNAA